MHKRPPYNSAKGRHAWIVAAIVVAVFCSPSFGTTAFAAPPGDATQISSQSGFVRSEFIYDEAPFPSCHASTIVELAEKKLLAAWFGGSDEGNSDVGIWIARHDDAGWSAPVEVADGFDDGKRFPCWNPVLFRSPNGALILFYKVGPSPSEWWGLLKRSSDDGVTWSAAERLPAGFLGPIKNKPVLLADGTLLCGSSTEHDGWRVQLERTGDLGKTWKKTAPLNDGRTLGLIQPTIFSHPHGKLQILCRSQQKYIIELWSDDDGLSWTAPRNTSLVNPNSGIDGVTLHDGKALLVYNHTERGRSPLNVAVSSDGKVWSAALVLENTPGEFSYPAVIQTNDRQVHVTYTWNRKKIKHVVINPARLALQEMPDGKWPK